MIKNLENYKWNKLRKVDFGIRTASSQVSPVTCSKKKEEEIEILESHQHEIPIL
jgi:hypothetical protein